MTTFQTVASGDYAPNSTGITLGQGEVPARVTVTQLGNWGTGNPVGKLQVQRIAGGSWYDVSGATITDNGTVSAYVLGVATRWVVPTLTAPGTTTTAPRVAMAAQPLLKPSGLDGDCPIVEVSNNYYNAAAGTTGNLPTTDLAAFAQLNPNITPIMQGSKALIFLTQDGAGTSFIESTLHDGDGAFTVQEGASLTGVSGQVAVESYADSTHVNFTDGTGTTKLWLDVFRVPA